MSKQQPTPAPDSFQLTVATMDETETLSGGFTAQVGALPVRGIPGTYEVLMITSRDTGRWVIPKGWPMKNKKDHEAAAQEAFEEAGVAGMIHKHPMGAYVYGKGRGDAEIEAVRVMVYLLEVRDVMAGWPEKKQRKRKWMTPHGAAALVEEQGLASILERLNDWPDRRTPVSGS